LAFFIKGGASPWEAGKGEELFSLSLPSLKLTLQRERNVNITISNHMYSNMVLLQRHVKGDMLHHQVRE
jgi:hypothetical protein